ncbi:winged helix-turn-helix domain-containing protein [Mycobacterium yunnanensis]|uniref:Winged helix-turn-helix domain-containing protein n=1 Tax=Mycobacterium yunnanensis TaxID=368477 RepID=A0A9X2Z1S0_9MYCO|nr:BTAD domain-containing putative transcriptional regulator [Mycobacterium yunnanensis]MCV7420557.1 winged helix-turn-helix domain-containing protein [Mycobacterium yunnanensis]
MRVRDLGALTVTVDGVDRPVAGSRAAAILALLVINVNERVSVQALLDATWGDRATDATVSTLESHVWRLRQLLEPHRGQRQPPAVLVNENTGYRLVADGHAVDSLSFGQIGRDAGDLFAAGRAEAAIARAEEALQLWRGQPYGALGEQSWAQPAVARLEELRRHIGEIRLDALIAAGRFEQALADLETMVADAPFRERLRAQQMLALYRGGRAEEALAVFQRTRAVLVDELGTEPGPELRDLHARILDQDSSLAGTPRAAPIVLSLNHVHLPATLTPLAGRESDLAQVSALLESNALVTLTGAAGIGKTRLAVEVGRAAAGRFPDGVWFVDLAAVTDTALVVDAVVSTLGIASSPASTPLEDLAHYGRGRDVLIVLDNCEHVVAAVATLATAVLGHGDGRCTLLATSRTPLDVDVEVTWTVAPLAISGSPETSRDGPAVQLFLDRLRRVDPALAIDDEVRAAAGDICAAVDGLPLAIELAAARARSHSLHDVRKQSQADVGAWGRTGHRETLRSAIDSSHAALDSVAALVHRRLAVLPGSFTTAAATAVAGDLAAAEVDDALATLVHHSMLTSTATREPSGHTVFRQLATVRAHAAHTLREHDDADSAAERRDQWTAQLIASRPRLGRAGEHAWFDALDDDDATVRASLAGMLLNRADPGAARLCAPLGFYWYFRARITEGARWLGLARDAADGHHRADWTAATVALASAFAAQGRVESARPLVGEALGRLGALPDDALVDVGESLVILGAALWVHPDVELITEVHAALQQLAARSTDPELQLFADIQACSVTALGGGLAAAAARAEELHDAAVLVGNDAAAWLSAATPMTAAVLHDDPERGIVWVRRVMQAHLAAGGTSSAGMFIENRANYETQRGSHQQAARLYAAARAHTRRAAMVWPRRPVTADLLATTRKSLLPSVFEEAWQNGETWQLADVLAVD